MCATSTFVQNKRDFYCGPVTAIFLILIPLPSEVKHSYKDISLFMKKKSKMDHSKSSNIFFP